MGFIFGYGGGLFGILALVCAVWIIYDVFTNNKQKSQEWKIIWTVLAIVLNVIAAIVYYLMYKN